MISRGQKSQKSVGNLVHDFRFSASVRPLGPDQFDSTIDYIVSRSQTAYFLILGWENIGSGILTVKLSQLSPVLRWVTIGVNLNVESYT